jgi:transposase
MAPLLPQVRRGGRRRTTDLCKALSAILYLACTSRQWRMPQKAFPPDGTVHGYFRRFWQEGIWHRIWMILLMAVRVIAACAAARARLRLRIAKRDPHAKSFEVLPRR